MFVVMATAGYGLMMWRTYYKPFADAFVIEKTKNQENNPREFDLEM
jgi:hypothetical protein